MTTKTINVAANSFITSAAACFGIKDSLHTKYEETYWAVLELCTAHCVNAAY